MIKLKIEMDTVKIHKESKLSLEETYSKINEVINSFPTIYIKGDSIYSQDTPNGLNDVGVLLVLIEDLVKHSWFLPYVKHLWLIDRDGAEDMLPSAKILPFIKTKEDCLKYKDYLYNL